MSESNSGLSDEIAVEHVSAEAEAEANDAANSTVEDVDTDTEQESLEEVVESDAADSKLVLNTEAGWTVQSQHGVLLPHEIPSQDYAAIEADPAERTDIAVDQDW